MSTYKYTLDDQDTVDADYRDESTLELTVTEGVLEMSYDDVADLLVTFEQPNLRTDTDCDEFVQTVLERFEDFLGRYMSAQREYLV